MGIKLDLACGQRKQPGFVGVDIVALPGVDIVHDLEVYPWPFEDASVEEIHCSHYLEHTVDLIKFFDECYRILIPGGTLRVIAPYYTSIRCWQDPTHRHAISEHTFFYFDAKQREKNDLSHYPIKSDFSVVTRLIANPVLAGRSKEECMDAIRHNWNVVDDIDAVLTKRS